MNKSLALLLAVLLLIFSSTMYISPVKAKSIFTDVDHHYWALNEIMFLQEKGIINGFPDGTFKPDDTITRLQAVLMIIREKGITDFSSVSDPGFTDVRPGDTGYDEIAKLVELGTINGQVNEKGERIFAPSDSLTRAQMAKILSITYKIEGNSEIIFSDVLKDHWGYPYVQALAQHNITIGYGDGRFGESDNITRAQFSTMMARTLDKSFRPQLENDLPSTPIEIPVLMYHILLEGQNNSISVDPARFREQMQAIKAAGYQTITDYEVYDFLINEEPLPKNPILITFDDGYKSNYTDAYPILNELGMKATIYVITSRIFDEPNIQNGEWEKLTWNDAREMSGTILIQSHTWDSHRMVIGKDGFDRGLIASPVYFNGVLESLTEYEDRVLSDLIQSKKVIEEKLGYKVISIAYPYGDYSLDTVRLAQQAGYKLAFTVKDGTVRKGDPILELERITADGSYSGEELVNVIEQHKDSGI